MGCEENPNPRRGAVACKIPHLTENSLPPLADRHRTILGNGLAKLWSNCNASDPGLSRGEVITHRQPPYNLDAEQALLGAILINNEAMDRVSGFLDPEHFYDPLHQRIYEVLGKLIQAGKQATPITLRTFFESAEPIEPGLTVPQYLGRLAVNATTIINAAEYGRTIYDLATRRALIVIGEDMVNAAYDATVDQPPEHQIEEVESRLHDLISNTVGGNRWGVRFADDPLPPGDGSYCVKGIIGSQSTAMLYGAPGTGKSTLAIDIAFKIALDLPWFGNRVQPGGVVYVAYEGQGGIPNRVAAAASFLGNPGKKFAWMSGGASLASDVGRIIAATKEVAKCTRSPVRLVIIDTLARALADENENEAAGIAAASSHADRIKASTGGAVLLIHHPGKDKDRGPRGSSAIRGCTDALIRVERRKDGAIRTVNLEKAREGLERQLAAFVLKSVKVATDADGDDVTACVAAVSAPLKMDRKRLNPKTAAGKALEALRQLIIDGEYDVVRGQHEVPDGAKCVPLVRWQETCQQKKLSPRAKAKDTERRVFERAVKALVDDGYVGQLGALVWTIEDEPDGDQERGRWTNPDNDPHEQ
jgi:hypothetical protein